MTGGEKKTVIAGTLIVVLMLIAWRAYAWWEGKDKSKRDIADEELSKALKSTGKIESANRLDKAVEKDNAPPDMEQIWKIVIAAVAVAIVGSIIGFEVGAGWGAAAGALIGAAIGAGAALGIIEWQEDKERTEAESEGFAAIAGFFGTPGGESD